MLQNRTKMKNQKLITATFLLLLNIALVTSFDYNLIFNIYNEMSTIFERFSKKYGNFLMDNIETMTKPSEWTPASTKSNYIHTKT